MTLRKILALTCLLLPMIASAHQFETGQRVPPIGITDRGELVLDKDQFSYKTWNSAQLVGKVRVLQHIAGRTSAKEKNATLIEAIKSAKLPHDRYQTTTIVNTDDAIPGSGMFVRSSLESNKKLYPWSQFIVDSNGVARGAWQLDEESSAVVVLDKDGRVQWAKDGALTPEEVQQVMAPAAKVATNNGNNVNSAKIIFPYRYLWDRGIKSLSSYAELILVTLVALF